MQTLYFHIGLTKTASTYLQKVIFPLFESKSYLDRPQGTILDLKYGQKYISPAPVLTAAFRRSPKVWEDMGEDLFDSIIDSLPDATEANDLIISDECADSSGDPLLLHDHLTRFIKLGIAKGYGRVRVLVIIRRQAERMASLYAQLSDRVRGASQRNFEAWVRELLDTKQAFYDKGYLYDYYDVYEAVKDVVGVENLLMLPYEHLRDDPSGFVRTVSEHFEATAEEVASIAGVIEAEKDNSARNVRSLSHNSWKLRTPSKLGPSAVDLVPAAISRKVGKQYRLLLPDVVREDSIQLGDALYEEIMSRYSRSNERLKHHIPELEKFRY